MSVLSVRINEQKRKLLKIISALEEKTIGGLIEFWIDEHVEKNKAHYYSQLADSPLIDSENDLDQIAEWLKVPAPEFKEWDNEDDDIYNDM